MKKIIYLYIGIAVLLVVAAGIYVDQHVSVRTGLENQNVLKNQNNASKSTKTSAPELGNYGTAPDFVNVANWINTKPLTIADLKGKVVLIDFWTYSCINCIRTLPHVTTWYNTYKNKGLVVVGVHTPEFAFEQNAGNVENAVKQFGIAYPVAQDNVYGTWSAYSNQYWPAEYLINQQGQIVYEHFGEGNYDKTENAIRTLLGLDQTTTTTTTDTLNDVGSPEMYFGTARLENLTNKQPYSLTAKDYTLNKNIDLNTFSLGGNWIFSQTDAELLQDNGQVNLKFHSGKLYMVASSDNPVTLHITVDGKTEPNVIVQESKLYTLFDSNAYTDHVIEINIVQKGLKAFTFTFG